MVTRPLTKALTAAALIGGALTGVGAADARAQPVRMSGEVAVRIVASAGVGFDREAGFVVDARTHAQVRTVAADNSGSSADLAEPRLPLFLAEFE
ncbi:MAG: hypothetical protein V2J26_02815 [Pacificimonas sp.]|jgi:hypothetical protein|nr:hypothetical protein [Pacificimonas sp.]